METQNNKPSNQQKSRNSLTLASQVFKVMAIFIVVMSCSSIFAETYEVTEDGQYYLIEEDQYAVSASKKRRQRMILTMKLA